MKRILSIVWICLCISFTVSAQTNFKTLNELYSISGNQTIAGQQNRSYWDNMNTITGDHAGLWGEDFSFYNWGGTNSMAEWRTLITNEAKARWNEGAVVAFTFHGCPPTVAEPCQWSNVTDHLSDSQWTELITDGSTLNINWKARLDLIAGYLQDLEDSGVEVLFRPFHEMNHPYVFWWANRPGPNGSSRLYQITHDYLVNTKGLSNLIFVWNLQDFGTLSSDLNNYNPGNAYWDVLSLDMYSSDGQGYTTAKYNALLNKAGSKPIAIGECEILPTKELLQSQPRWAYFMGWAELTQQKNSDAQISDVYNATNVITLKEMPGWKSVPLNLASKKPVTVSSTEIGANVAANVTDGSYTTRWSSLYTDPQWMYVDLQDVYNINEVKITWEAAYGKNYYIETSLDAQAWTHQRTVTNNTTLTNDFTGLNVNARYVRIYGTARATAYGYSIYELEVYGKALPKPYSGTAISIPGTIQAENYDLGGEGVAFHDLNGGTNSPVFRTDKTILEACTDAGGGYNLADIQATEWTNYSINVLVAGAYDFKVRVAATAAGKTFHIEMDGVNVTGPIAVPNTGGWQTWQTVTVSNINLTAGNKAMRVVMDSDLFNLNYIQIVAPIITSLEFNDKEAEFNVFPNPSVGNFQYTLPCKLADANKIEIISTMGNSEFQLENAPITGSISLEHLSTGMYFFKVSDETTVVIKPILIVR